VATNVFGSSISTGHSKPKEMANSLANSAANVIDFISFLPIKVTKVATSGYFLENTVDIQLLNQLLIQL
jgi:hypothetical protein